MFAFTKNSNNETRSLSHIRWQLRRSHEFLQRSFRRRIVGLQRFSENPGMPVPDEKKNQILHCRLEFDGNVLMASEHAGWKNSKWQQCKSYPRGQGSCANGKSFQSISRGWENWYAFTGYFLECLLRYGYR